MLHSIFSFFTETASHKVNFCLMSENHLMVLIAFIIDEFSAPSFATCLRILLFCFAKNIWYFPSFAASPSHKKYTSVWPFLLRKKSAASPFWTDFWRWLPKSWMLLGNFLLSATKLPNKNDEKVKVKLPALSYRSRVDNQRLFFQRQTSWEKSSQTGSSTHVQKATTKPAISVHWHSWPAVHCQVASLSPQWHIYHSKTNPFILIWQLSVSQTIDLVCFHLYEASVWPSFVALAQR